MNKKEYDQRPLWGSKGLEKYFDGRKTWYFRKMDDNEEDEEGDGGDGYMDFEEGSAVGGDVDKEERWEEGW